MSAGDTAEVVSAIANVVMAGAAAAALIFGWVQLAHASKIRDMEYLNAQRELIGEHWRKTREGYAADAEKGKFEFGELLDCYERTCFILNKLHVGKRTYRFFRDHILEVILTLSKDEFLWAEMQNLKSGPRTYCEIQRFLDCNKACLKEIEKARLSILAH